MDHHEEASQEPVISRSRVSIMSRPSQQQASGASRPHHAEARLPGTSHRARRRGSKRELDSVGSNGRCKKSCTSDRTSEVPVLPPGSSHPPAVASDLAAEGSSSESGIGSASASSAIQDHSYSLVNELRTLESANSDLRVTEHSYSLASIGALEAPSTQQFPPTLRRSSRRSARLLTTASRRARARSREESAEPISITSPSRRSNRLLSMTRSGGRPFSMEDEPASSLFVSNQGREYSRLATGGRRASRTQSREESPEVISIADPIRELSQPQEMPVATENNQDVVETEPPSEMETMRTDPVHHPTEPPALIAVADGTDHLTESFLTSSLDFIRSRSREREARQGRMRTLSHRRSARVANTRRMHTTRRQSAPDVAPPPLPHVLPLPHTTAVRHPLMYTHIPMNLQLFRQPQTDSIHRAMSVLLPSLPSLEPLSSQPTSSVLSRTTPGNTEEASGSVEAQSDSGLGQGSTQGSDEIQMWSEDSVEVPLHSRHYQHLHRSSRSLPHLHRRARRNAQPSILNDISEADLRSLHSRIPQDVDSDVISGDSPGLERLRRQRTTSAAAAAAPASTRGANAPIDVVVVDSDSEEDGDQDVIIINDERPPTESSDRPRSHAATGGDSSPPRLTALSFLESVIARRRERMTRGFLEVELNPVLHMHNDGNYRMGVRRDGRDSDRRNGRDPETRGRTLLISATPSVVPRVAEEEEIDSDMVFEVPHQDWQNILIPRSEQQHFPRRPSLFPPPPVMWYPTLESRFHTFEELLDLADDLGPARSHGLTQDEINQLDVRCFGDWDSDSSIDSKCVVCLSEYKCPEKVRTLSCGHLFHQPCIDQWLLGHRTCPICRIDVRSS